ncbi:MAG: type IV secretion protein IcmJ [Gammaproteobacteria bacterium RIFCSPHIGHO2_12_FULL_41_20]|nr:MAG: type IV secretion protein IcmJ [Gammaproteobacteria bacterium RIFCSPHIGHO2_12_FULL_41_20]
MELQLAANLSGWRLFVRRKEDKAFLPVAKRVFERDQYTCQYCGFLAQEYQEIANVDGNYTNNKLSNMITTCCFCSQCLFLQAVGYDDMSGGQLIFLPEVSQANLNSFCHVLFCAMGNGTGYQDSAQAIYRSLKFRSQPIETKFGSGTSNPAVFGQLLIENPHPDMQANLLKDVRLLPSYTKFKIQLEAWAAAALKELEAESPTSKEA